MEDSAKGLCAIVLLLPNYDCFISDRCLSIAELMGIGDWRRNGLVLGRCYSGEIEGREEHHKRGGYVILLLFSKFFRMLCSKMPPHPSTGAKGNARKGKCRAFHGVSSLSMFFIVSRS